MLRNTDNPMFSTDDHRYMTQALRLAERGLYTTTPNPRVGCVIVKAGQVSRMPKSTPCARRVRPLEGPTFM